LVVVAAPCGHCRQFLNEIDSSFLNPDFFTIHIRDGKNSFKVYSLGDLLPCAFTPVQLNCKLSLPLVKPFPMSLKAVTPQ